MISIVSAQLNPIVGDVAGNTQKICAVLEKAPKADLVVTPELALCGYPPLDLLHRADLLHRVEQAIETLKMVSQTYSNTGLLVGVPCRSANGLTNSALLIYQGDVIGQYDKQLFPTYDVFDEARYFKPGKHTGAIPFKTAKLGVHICEDAWYYNPEIRERYGYTKSPIAPLIHQGATHLINLSGSPYYIEKPWQRLALFETIVKTYKRPYYFVNQTGGNDELVFDGHSCALSETGKIMGIAPAFEEGTWIVSETGNVTLSETHECLERALVTGIRDYVQKTGFKKVIIGLSGGIDSAVTAALSVKALGKDHVLGVLMPSPYSSQGSIDDALELAKNLGIQTLTLSITDGFQCLKTQLKETLATPLADLTEQNLQSRLRGTFLMALANQHQALVMTTGNKSEMAVGYCTLYGDMNGALAPLGDVYKTQVYALANRLSGIPKNTLEKPPSAELKPDQKDQDSLPEYDLLDRMLFAYLEEHASEDDMVQQGMPEHWVRWVVRQIKISEYKRFQAAPILKVSQKAFGIGRRMPMAAL